MTNTAKAFWNNPLNEVKTLCDRTFSYFVEADKDMKNLYHEDLEGFQNAIELFKQSDAEALATLVSEMDTEPREQIFRDLCEISRWGGGAGQERRMEGCSECLRQFTAHTVSSAQNVHGTRGPRRRVAEQSETG